MGAGGAAPEPFGAHLRRRRRAAGLTQEGLAERAGLSVRGVSDLERGARRAPQRETVRLLARALGLRPAGAAALEAAAAAARATGAARPPPDEPGPAPAAVDQVPHNLPLPLTSFVGRERELAAVAALLGAHRLVTLTGAGGTGKTRLALQAAADALEAYPDGAWLAELGALADPALVPHAVAGAVGVREEPGRPLIATLTDALRPRRLLLVLDNCEHLLDAGARLADALLRACPEVRILATSREALGIAGEAPYRVPSLALPEPGSTPPVEALGRYEAVTLFVERAAIAQPGFAVTDRNAAAVVRVCARLDGLPLALELAAARVGVLPVAQLLGRLEDRFRLLTGGSRTALERHQTLRAAVDWSYDLLTGPEQRLFARLAVFAGGWTLEAAEQVGGGDGRAAEEVLELLTRLVDQSLVVVDEQPDGTARYRLLETLREYARERLVAGGQADAVHRRLLAYCTTLAETAEPALQGAAQEAWLARLERDHDNCRAALRWAAAGAAPEATELGLRLAGALAWPWVSRGFLREPSADLDALLAVPAAGRPSVARAKALALAAWLARRQGDPAAARARREECAALVRALGETDTRALSWTLRMLGHLIQLAGPPAAARAWLTESVALFRQAGDQAGLAFALASLGRLAYSQGDYVAAERAHAAGLVVNRRLGDRDREAAALNSLGALRRAAGDAAGARPFHEEALAIWRGLGYENGVAGALTGLGAVALAAGDHARARALLVEAGERFRAIASRDGEAHVLRGLALVARATGDGPTTRTHLRAALSIWGAMGAWPRIAETLEGLAALAADDGQASSALLLAGAAAAVRRAAGWPLAPRGRAALRHRLAPARQALGRHGAAAAVARGRALSPEQAVDEAVAGGQAAGGGVPGGAAAPERRPVPDETAGLAGAAPRSPGGPLRVEAATYTVWRGGQPLPRPLAAKEFALVHYLYERAERVCTRQELGDTVWGRDRWDPAMLYRLVRRVKEKLEPHPARPRYLRNVPGFGYRLAP